MAKKKAKVLKPIDPAFLEAARNEALKSEKFSDKQIAEFALLWLRQETLPKDLRQLGLATIGESGWVLTHLVQKFSSSILRRQDGEVSKNKNLENILLDLSSNQIVDIEKYYMELKQYGHDTEISKLLFLIELGLVGLHTIAAIVARSYGLIDLTTTFVSDGNMGLTEIIETSEKLEEEFYGFLSEHDLKFSSKIWIPPELYSPNNFNS